MCCLEDKMRSEMTLSESQNRKSTRVKKLSEILNVEDMLTSSLCSDSCCRGSSPPIEGEFSQESPSVFTEDVHTGSENIFLQAGTGVGSEDQVLSLNCVAKQKKKQNVKYGVNLSERA